MSSDRVDIRVIVDSSDATETLANLWWAAARLAHPEMSDDELGELRRAELRLRPTAVAQEPARGRSR
jgi:hypothetical protein